MPEIVLSIDLPAALGFGCALGCARGCPGSTCVSPVRLERCNTLSLPLSLSPSIWKTALPSLFLYPSNYVVIVLWYCCAFSQQKSELVPGGGSLQCQFLVHIVVAHAHAHRARARAVRTPHGTGISGPCGARLGFWFRVLLHTRM